MSKQEVTNLEQPSFENSISRLQNIVSLLEQEDQPLEESLQLYREGMVCARNCREALQQARHEISIWQNGEDVPYEKCTEDKIGEV